ncbi:MAG: type IV pilus modification PilV family protein [Syntrophomonadaceae bacterium]|jgi:prepilin-type N-terminal cleavage/methylation domain-containing protein
MSVNLGANKKQAGFTLIEVLAALVILALLTTSIMTMFSVSELWIGRAGKQTIASDYAISIIEVIRAYSSDLADLPLSPDFEVTDANVSDQVFSFRLLNSKPPINVDAPPNLKAAVTITRYDESSWYNRGGMGSQDIISFPDNLFQLQVTVYWTEGGHDKSLQMLTIVGAK